jgi:hypothetical protein
MDINVMQGEQRERKLLLIGFRVEGVEVRV